MKFLKIVAISDTHDLHNEVTIPECDILIHVGDATGLGGENRVRNFANWFSKQPAKHKIFIPGNHELDFEEQLPHSKQWFYDECPDGHLLINDTIELEGVKIHGVSYTPEFHNWAFNVPRGEKLKALWDMIPLDTDILATHGPAYGVLDYAPACGNVGCQDLLVKIQELKIPVHMFGHIHYSHGQEHNNGTSSYNLSICTEMYTASNPVTVIDYVVD